MQKGLVSVVIPNYNYARYLREAIDGVLSQSIDELEVIVVDDGSKDDSRKLIEDYGDRIQSIFQKNQGVSAARNNGAALSRGEFIAFLDADDVWLPRKIEKQLELFAANDDIGLVHVGVMDIDAEGRELVSKTEGGEGDVSFDLLRLSGPVILGGGSGMMLRRSIFDKIGGFDLRMSTSADWDIFYRASSVCKVGFVPEVLLKYRVHGSNMHSNVKAMEHDMLIGYDKAFNDSKAKRIRNESFARFYAMLSGSYLHAGEHLNSIRTGLLSFRYGPVNFVRRTFSAIGRKR